MQKPSFSVKKIKQQVKERLAQFGIFDESEADWLVATVLGTTRGGLALVNQVNKKQAKQIEKATRKRCKGMPLDAIVGHTSFFGHTFFVSRHVLSPRPETELLTEWAAKWAKQNNAKALLDLCTGSGAIAIVAKKQLPSLQVIASDVSQKALTVAKKNAKNLGANVEFVRSNMFENLKGVCVDILVSNPPYIATKQLKTLDREVQKYDPRLALDGGEDGLTFYKIIATKAPFHLRSGGALALEVGFDQAENVAKLLAEHFENIQILNDYNHIARMVVATKKDSK